MKEYLIKRFIRNNHNKYAKYVNEWISGLTDDQIAYFKLEKERLNEDNISQRTYR